MRKIGSMDNRGDAVMVTSVLILSIALSVGSSYLLDYGEIVGKEDDMTHLADVQESLLRIRASMNSLLVAGDTDTLIINRMTLGTNGNPYLTVARSSGTLTQNSNPNHFYMELVLESGGSEMVLDSLSGAITYESNNYYFHDQTYYFTAGGVILEQYGSYVMSSYPDISISPTPSGYSMELNLFGLTGEYWKISGIESMPLTIRMAGRSSVQEDLIAGDVLSIRVNGIGEQAWYDYFRGFLTEKGFSEGSDFTVDPPADWTDPNDKLEVDLTMITQMASRFGEMEVTI
ncbi:MAG: hypothetical protein ACMUIE_03235 [Thermoplasmatota archaeon]